jgi:hypothetical protein
MCDCNCKICEKCDEKLVYVDEYMNRFDFKNLTYIQKKNIIELTSIFENSTKEIKWDYCKDIKDGRGYTCGISGFCSGTGDLVQVFKEYVSLCDKDEDKEGEELYKILKEIHNDNTKKLDDLPKFFKKNKDNEKFRSAQLMITNKLYVNAANELAEKYNLKNALSIGQMFDASTNHGKSGANKIAKEIKIKDDQDENHWLKHFLKERKKILKDDDTWKYAVDRIKVYQKLLDDKNYDLNLPIKVKCYGDKYTL